MHNIIPTSQFYGSHCEYLKSRLDKICSAIGFDDSRVTWNLYSKRTLMEFIGQPSHKLIREIIEEIKRHPNQYGYCNPETNEVWISEDVVTKASFSFLKGSLKSLETLHGLRPKTAIEAENLLTLIILDEITHLQTGKDHGDKRYEEKLKENKRKCASLFS